MVLLLHQRSTKISRDDILDYYIFFRILRFLSLGEISTRGSIYAKKWIKILPKNRSEMAQKWHIMLFSQFSRAPKNWKIFIFGKISARGLFFLEKCLFTWKISFSNMMRFLIKWNLKGPQGTLRSGAKYLVILVIFYGSKIRKWVKVES